MQTSMRVKGPTLQSGSPAPDVDGRGEGQREGDEHGANLKWGWAIVVNVRANAARKRRCAFAQKVRRARSWSARGRGQMIYVTNCAGKSAHPFSRRKRVCYHARARRTERACPRARTHVEVTRERWRTWPAPATRRRTPIHGGGPCRTRRSRREQPQRSATRVIESKEFKALVTKRWTVSMVLLTLLFVSYYGYVILVATAKDFVNTKLGGVTTLAIPLGHRRDRPRVGAHRLLRGVGEQVLRPRGRAAQGRAQALIPSVRPT